MGSWRCAFAVSHSSKRALTELLATLNAAAPMENLHNVERELVIPLETYSMHSRYSSGLDAGSFGTKGRFGAFKALRLYYCM